MEQIVYSAITNNLKEIVKDKNNFLILKVFGESYFMIQKNLSYISPFFILDFQDFNSCIVYEVKVL